MSDKQKYLKRLEKGFDSFNKLVVPRFVKGPYGDEITTGYIERYLKLLAALIEQLPRHAVDKYIEAYGDILKDIIEKDKGESKTTYIDVFTGEYQKLLDTFLTVETGEEVRNKRRVLMKRGNSEEMEINQESVRRLNELFTVFAKTSTELDINVVKHLLEIYTRTVDTFIYEGVSIESFSLTADLEDIFDTYALKDRLNEIRLEIGDLSDDEIKDSLDTLDKDITRLLDTDWGENDITRGNHEQSEEDDDTDDYDLDYDDEFSPMETPTEPKEEQVVTKQETETKPNEVVEAPVEENQEESQEESQEEEHEEETYDDIQVEQTSSEHKQEQFGDTDISHMLDDEDLRNETPEDSVVQEEVTEDSVIDTADQAYTQSDEEEIEIEDDVEAETEFEAVEEETEFEAVDDTITENLLETEAEEEPEKKEESFNIKNFFQN